MKYSVWHRHAHVGGSAGAWYQRYKDLEFEEARAKPRPLLGLTKIIPDGEFPQDGPVQLPTMQIVTNPEITRGCAIMVGGSLVFIKVDKGVIKCPADGCDGANFQANLQDGEVVLSCTKCGHDLRG